MLGGKTGENVAAQVTQAAERISSGMNATMGVALLSLMLSSAAVLIAMLALKAVRK